MKSNLEKFHLRTSFSCPDQINRMQFPRREKILLCGVSIIPTNMLHIVDMFSFIVELAMVWSSGFLKRPVFLEML